jgi:hypothetical protein
MAKRGKRQGDGFRGDLAKLVRQLVEEGQESDRDSEPIAPLLREHLGGGAGARDLPVYTQELDGWELPNLQLALDEIAGRAGWDVRIVGIGGQARHYGGFGLGLLLTSDHFSVGAMEYVNVPVGPARTLACVELAVILLSTPDGAVALLVNRSHEHHEGPPLAVQAASPVEGLAQAFLVDLRERMDARDVYRGQLITVEVNRHGAHRIVFLERPVVAPEDVILPDGALEHIERHVLGPTRHREALVAQGRHLSRGLLLWGPPGTGKTHTVRYLTGRLEGATTLLLSGASLGMLSAFATLARRLAPSVVVLDDVDLIAQERTYGPFGESATLFELMNQMSGLADDADVAFVLTTNRPDALEPALAARPGRVDLAIEVPLPDSAARRRLLDLYGRGLALELEDPDAIVERTEGVTASFVKELLRRTALDVAEAGRATVTDADVAAALDELLGETGALTRAFLGVRRPGDPEPAPDPHAWMRGGWTSAG